MRESNSKHNLPVRAKVIKRNIDMIREAIVDREFEDEFLKTFVVSEEAKLAELQNNLDELSKAVSNITDEQAKVEANNTIIELTSAIEKTIRSIDNLKQNIENGEEYRKAMIMKLKFFKSKREEEKESRLAKQNIKREKLATQAIEALRKFPETVIVNEEGIDFKQATK